MVMIIILTSLSLSASPSSLQIFVFFIAYYILMIFLFSLLWLWAGSDGDPCSTGITNLTDAFYFSMITFTTIGYGSASTFFNSCGTISVIIFFESFMGIVFNAVILGVLFGKLQRGATRGTSIAYSKKALIREINNKLYFEFRVCEQRKLQIVEAHVSTPPITLSLVFCDGNQPNNHCLLSLSRLSSL